eukprot:ctg_166.g99
MGVVGQTADAKRRGTCTNTSGKGSEASFSGDDKSRSFRNARERAQGCRLECDAQPTERPKRQLTRAFPLTRTGRSLNAAGALGFGAFAQRWCGDQQGICTEGTTKKNARSACAVLGGISRATHGGRQLLRSRLGDDLFSAHLRLWLHAVGGRRRRRRRSQPHRGGGEEEYQALCVPVDPLLMATGSMDGAALGCAVNVGHELFHKRSEFEQYLGKALLVSVCYGHFFIEHVHGHHKRVGTPADPATARLGESFYRFLPRTLIGSYRSAWRLEHDRLRRNGLAVWGVHNQMLWFALLPLLEMTAFYVLSGPRACALFLLQSVTAIVLLEMVNYIEHYGLERRAMGARPNGELVYEAVSSKHSWNAAHRITNYMLFKLQRHPDHHKHVLHPYHVLRSDKESPQLPSSYPAMVLLLLIPPAWKRVMDARLRRYNCDPGVISGSGFDFRAGELCRGGFPVSGRAVRVARARRSGRGGPCNPRAGTEASTAVAAGTGQLCRAGAQSTPALDGVRVARFGVPVERGHLGRQNGLRDLNYREGLIEEGSIGQGGRSELTVEAGSLGERRLA